MPHCKGIWQIYEISHSLCKPFEIGMLCFIAHRPVTYKGTKLNHQSWYMDHIVHLWNYTVTRVHTAKLMVVVTDEHFNIVGITLSALGGKYTIHNLHQPKIVQPEVIIIWNTVPYQQWQSTAKQPHLSSC